MTFTNYISAFFEALKFKNPKVFAVVQGALIFFLVTLEFRPEWITQFIMLTANEISLIQVFFAGTGILASTSTTDGLSRDHKKVQEIEMKNAGELDPETTKL